MSSQPGKCINQDLQDPNQIKWMITTKQKERKTQEKSINQKYIQLHAEIHEYDRNQQAFKKCIPISIAKQSKIKGRFIDQSKTQR